MKLSGISFKTSLPSFALNNQSHQESTQNMRHYELINTVYFLDVAAYDSLKDTYNLFAQNLKLLFEYEQTSNAALVYGPILKFIKPPYTPKNIFRYEKLPNGIATLFLGTRDNEIIQQKGITLDTFADRDNVLLDMLALEEEYAVKTLVVSQFVDSTYCFEIMQKQKKMIFHDQNMNFHMLFYLLTRIFGTNGMISIKELVEETGYSRRHVYQTFKNQFGLGIKFFSRLVRFQTALAWLLNDMGKSIDIAHEFGFFDQAHFFHEFYQMVNDSPQYLNQIFKDRFTPG